MNFKLQAKCELRRNSDHELSPAYTTVLTSDPEPADDDSGGAALIFSRRRTQDRKWRKWEKTPNRRILDGKACETRERFICAVKHEVKV